MVTPAVPLRVLVADDDPVSLRIVAATVRHAGHDVILADDGDDAVRLFAERSPDAVLLDADMPVMDGLEACRRIRALAGDRYVPVLFVTGASDDRLARCIEAGGDGFVSKPFSPVRLAAQLEAHRRTRDLHLTVQAQNADLTAHQARLLHEQEMARAVFARVLERGQLDATNLRHVLAPASLFCGDLLLAAQSPAGVQHLMLGDFTGHGLAAATGALPVSELFYQCTTAGYDLRAVITEIDERVASILPAGMFLAAAFVSWDARHGQLAVWNAGLPDALLYREGQGVVHAFASRHLPLGIRVPGGRDTRPELLAAAPDDRLLLHSDGLTEARAPDGTPFGEERLRARIDAAPSGDRIFDHIAAGHPAFQPGATLEDDVALVELRCRTDALPRSRAPRDRLARTARHPDATGGRLAFELEAAALRHADPTRIVTNALADFPLDRALRETVLIVVTELVANAVQHGLLGLSSSTKETPEGFADYYQRLELAREQLRQGWVRVEIEVVDGGATRHVAMRVSDSGAGFDPGLLDAPLRETGYAGRGLALVRSICDALRYRRDENLIEAELAWVLGPGSRDDTA